MTAQNSCPDGKIPYPNVQEARHVLRHGRRGRCGSNVYQCRHCGLWHTTSNPKTKRAKARQR